MAVFADDLRRIPMSAGLAATLARAAEYAGAQTHHEVALEHLLLALTEDDDATQVLTASHVDLSLLKADVSLYLGRLTDQVAPVRSDQLVIAPDLKRILEAAAAAANQGRRREINGAIVLAAIVGDGRSPAAHMLRAQGLTFEEAIKALQKAMAAAPAPAAAPAISSVPAPAEDAEDLIASARARVQTRAHVAPVPARAPAAWPPEVRPAGPAQVEHEEQPPLHDAVAAELAAMTGDGPDGGGMPMVGPSPAGEQPPPMPPEFHAEPFDAQDYIEPPPVPVQAQRAARPPPRQPGTRWPAPVAPAWKDAQAQPAPDASVPPPLPPPQDASGAGFYPAHDAGHWPHPPDPDPQLPNPAGEWPAPPMAEDYANVEGQRYDSPPPELWPQQAGYTPEAGEPWPPHELPHMHPGHVVYPQPPDWPYAPQPAAEAASDGQPATDPVHQADSGARPKRRRKGQDGAIATQVAETLPRRMRVRGAETVEVKVNAAMARALAEGLQATTGAMPAISVKLRAPDGGFAIDPLSPETHWFDDRPAPGDASTVSWRWTVKPLKRGRETLQLGISVRAMGADGRPVEQSLPEQIADVRVGGGFGRGSMRLLLWIALFVAGGMAVKFGNPAIEAMLTAIK